jgi:hypothetical protein
MDRMMYFAEEIARAVSTDFLHEGGRITADARDMSSEDFSSPHGALGALLWWTGEYARDYALQFPFATYEAVDGALAGYEPREIVLGDMSGPMMLYIFADFLRKELLPQSVEALDLTAALREFRSWCELNVRPAPAVRPSVVEDQDPE